MNAEIQDSPPVKNLIETKGTVTVRVQDRDMGLKSRVKVVQQWANAFDARFSESGGCVQVRFERRTLTNRYVGIMRVFDKGYPALDWDRISEKPRIRDNGASPFNATEVQHSAAPTRETRGNVNIFFQTTFPAGKMKGRLHEVFLLNGLGHPFAHAWLDTEVAKEDTLQIVWELTVGRDGLEYFPTVRNWVWSLPGYVRHENFYGVNQTRAL
jgi:hypothetical protein